MNFCRPAAEIKGYTDLFPDLFERISNEDTVLSFRTGKVYGFLEDDTWTDKEKVQLLEVVDETRESLVVNGFIRSDISYCLAPEMYFVLKYIVELDLTDDYLEVYMSYLTSNEEYERYAFVYERIEGILQILESELSAGEFYEVLMDVMYTGGIEVDKEIIEKAKNKIVKKKSKLLPKLEKVFAIF